MQRPVLEINANGQKLPTPKEWAFSKEYVRNGMNGTQAMLKTYDANSERNASVLAANKLGKNRIQKSIALICEEAGLTHNLIAESLTYDIIAKPADRVKELALGADILGMRQKTGIALQVNIGKMRDEFYEDA